ncbi:MAG: GspH/FimT family pseudopilin [Candidatus Rokuibacteriota bacterium]
MIQRARQAGYSLVELIITAAMISIVASFAFPSFLNYYRSANVRAAAQTVSAVLNQGRQLAIKNNLRLVAVCSTTSTIQFREDDCSGAAIPVVGLTDAANNVKVPAGVSLTTTASATFANLGNAAPGATYTVTDSASGRTLTVTVAPSGRITIP